MGKIRKITQETQNKFFNFYDLDANSARMVHSF